MEYEEIDEVVVLPKRYWHGKINGFVRFFNLMDEKSLAINIEFFIIGNR